MTALLAEASFQLPRLQLAPPVQTSAGKEAIDFAAKAGLILDPWQCYCLDLSLGEGDGGKWASFEVCLICGRQNGKNSILEARQLAGLFLFGEELIIHTAHQFKTARRSFRRLLRLIEQTPELDRRVAKVSRSHGEEGIELKNGHELQFLARSGQSARGFSGDLLIYDEAMFLISEDVGASLPLLSARTLATDGGPQVWYTASAGMMHSTQLARVRRRGIAGTDDALTFLEYSIDPHTPRCDPSCSKHDTPFTPESYLKANPALQTGRPRSSTSSGNAPRWTPNPSTGKGSASAPTRRRRTDGLSSRSRGGPRCTLTGGRGWTPRSAGCTPRRTGQCRRSR